VSAQCLAIVVFLAGACAAESPSISKRTPYERTFSEPASEVQAALDKLQTTLSGRLPTLDGFVSPGQQSLDHYQRPYYHCTVRVTLASSGGSVVSVSAKITAWYEGPPRPGYEALPSNGRLESDLLDRLQDSLAPKSDANKKAAPAPDISAPMPQLPERSSTIAVPDWQKVQDPALEDEARSLEAILHNQTHPTNLVAVKQDQTPVLEAASVNAKVLFLASAEDEFEVLDVNPGWVHVRISGLSRGWLRRSAVEMLEGSEAARTELPSSPRKSSEPDTSQNKSPFSVSSEEVGTFPGNWEPLKGKSTKIISAQQLAGSGRITSPQDKVQFAGSVFRKEILPAGVEGLVLIFDSEDGGMIASTREGLDQWRRGTISEASFWKQCLLDPPEILGLIN
jgi:hypothetical protein